MLMLALAVLLILVFSGLELLWPASRAKGDQTFNLKAWLLLLAVQFGPLPIIMVVTHQLRERFGLVVFDLATWPLWLGALVFIVAMDFADYWHHRAQHTFAWMWRIHALHHSDPAMNVTTSVRHSFIEPLFKGLTIWPLVAIVFSPTPTIWLIYGLVSLHNLYAHANLPISYGRFSWVAMAPAYHRLHHSTAPADFNQNYAQFFPIFDVLFGSYKQPNGVAETGLDERPKTLMDAALWPARMKA